MTPEERLTKIETILEKQNIALDKHNAGIQGLIVVARTCIDSIQELRQMQQATIQEMRELSKATDEKLNILIDTVDRIIRRDNGRPG